MAVVLKSWVRLLFCPIRIIRTVTFSTLPEFASSPWHSDQFRNQFVLEEGRRIEIAKWFPQHMYIGLKKMQAKLRNVDCVIEVHDARIPLCGRNPEFYRTLYAIKPHILILNKVDLIKPRNKESAEAILREQFAVKHVLWTNLKTNRNRCIRKIMGLAFTEIQEMPRHTRLYKTDYTVMVVGIPNTGKSTLINGIRSHFTGLRESAATGNHPGVTKKVMEKMRVHENPLVYILDTPGVLCPHLKDIEIGMKMALCETVLESHLDLTILTDYLLFKLNRLQRFQYVSKLNLDRPYDNGLEFLGAIAKRFDFKRSIQMPGEGSVWRPDYKRAATLALSKFRRGELGDQFLDSDIIESAT